MVFSVIVGFGILFSIFFSTILMARPGRNGANRILACLVLASGASICYQVLFPTGLFRTLPHLIKAYIPPQFLIGPLLYLYVRAISEPSFALRRRDGLHFLPFAASLAYLAPFLLGSGAEKIAFVESMVTPESPSSAEEWVVWIAAQASLWIYALLAARVFRAYRRRLRDAASNLAPYARNWLFVFLVSVFALLAGFLGVTFSMLRGTPLVAFNPFISTSLTAGILFLGWRGMLRLDYISMDAPSADASVPGGAMESALDRKPANGASAGARVAASTASIAADGAAEAEIARFEAVKAEVARRRLYRTSDLTLPELASALGYSRTDLSRVINLGGGMNFYDFINRLRVDDVRRRLESGEGESNVLELAFDAGFNAKSTFHSSFKRWTGATPSGYRRDASAAKGRG